MGGHHSYQDYAAILWQPSFEQVKKTAKPEAAPQEQLRVYAGMLDRDRVSWLDDYDRVVPILALGKQLGSSL